MARRELIGEAYVKLSAETDGFARDLAKARAEAEATLRELGGSKRVQIDIDVDTAEARAEIRALENAAAEAELAVRNGRNRGKFISNEEKQARKDALKEAREELRVAKLKFQSQLRVLAAQRELLSIIQKIEAIERKVAKEKEAANKKEVRDAERAEAAKRKAAEQKRAADRRAVIEAKTLQDRQERMQRNAELHEERMAAAKARTAAAEARAEAAATRAAAAARREEEKREKTTTEPKKRSLFWRIFTNSDSIGESFKKLMREPVKLGPFTATVKGLTTAMTFLAPLVTSVVGGLSAMAGTVGGALTGALAVGTAGVLGFGQGFLGLGMVLSPVVKEFHAASLVTDAYARAVQKYGAGSKQAKKAQEQMNNTLKSVSPTAREAYQNLSKVQTVFAGMTAAARPAIERTMRSMMQAFSSMAPSFAKQTVAFTEELGTGTRRFFNRMRTIEKRPGDTGGKGDGSGQWQFLSITFKNATAALDPLLRGLTYLWEGMAKIGSSASRFLKPLAELFSGKMLNFKNSLNNTERLNRVINMLMMDFLTVSHTIGAATSLLVTFFNAGRSQGRGLFDSLSSTFERWEKFLNENPGKVQAFFSEAAAGFRDLARLITLGGLALVTFSHALAPLVSGIMAVVMAAANLVAGFMKMEQATRIMQALGVAIATGFAVSKIAGFVAALGGALVAVYKFATETIAALTAIQASTAIGLLIGVLAGLAAYFFMNKSEADKFSSSLDDLDKKATDLSGTLSDLASRKTTLKLEQAGLRNQMAGMSKQDPRYAGLAARLAETEKELNRVENQQAASAGKTTKEYEKQLKAKQETKELADRLRRGEQLDTSTQQRRAEEYLRNEKSRLREIETLRRRIAAQRLIDMRVAAGANEVTSRAAKSGLANLSDKFGAKSKITTSIALNPRFNDQEIANVSRTAIRAANAGLSRGAILKIVADSSSADQSIRELRAAVRRQEVKKILTRIVGKEEAERILAGLTRPRSTAISVGLLGVGNAFSQLRNLSDEIGRTMGRMPNRAEGGPVIGAASGYTKQTAHGSAKRRAPRRAMGAFREPTFLVGEENRTEYVIATNPAYRSQNKKYLASAAAELGMSVSDGPIMAAGGYSPRVMALGYFQGKATANEIKRAKRRASVLEKKITKYGQRRPKPKKGSTAFINNQADRNELENLRGIIHGSKNKRVIKAGQDMRTLEKRISNYDTYRELAQANGGKVRIGSKTTLTLAQIRDNQLKTISALIRRYDSALQGTRGAEGRETLKGAIAELRLKAAGIRKGDQSSYEQAEQSKKDAMLTSLQNSSAINSAFVEAAGSMLGGSFSSSGSFVPGSEVVASGGSRMSRKGAAGAGGPTIVINTLHPADPDTLSAIGEAATGGLSLQGSVTSPRMVVG